MRTLSAAIALLLMACSQDRPAAPPPAGTQTAAAADMAGGVAPIELSVNGPAGAPMGGSSFDVDIVVTRRSATALPLTIQASVPQGVRLLAGQVTETITDPGDVVRRRLTLQADAVPSSDLIVNVDMRGPSSGAHATAAYRFGRPEPTASPVARGNPLVVHGQSLGQPVPLAPPTHSAP